MLRTRSEALTAVLGDLVSVEIGLNEYYDDAEPQGVIDNVLTGKINSLRAFCQVLGWSELVAHMKDMTPLQGNAIESLATIQNFVVPEARRLLAATDVERPQSPTQWFWDFVHVLSEGLSLPRQQLKSRPQVGSSITTATMMTSKNGSGTLAWSGTLLT